MYELYHGLTSEEIEEFWKRVKIDSENTCWEWQGGYNGDGYGYFKVSEPID